MDVSHHPLSYEIYQWPEFKAFCERLGVAWKLPTTRLVIELPAEDQAVKITQEYFGEPVPNGPNQKTIETPRPKPERKWAPDVLKPKPNPDIQESK